MAIDINATAIELGRLIMSYGQTELPSIANTRSYHNFIKTYMTSYKNYEQTWKDLCVLMEKLPPLAQLIADMPLHKLVKMTSEEIRTNITDITKPPVKLYANAYSVHELANVLGTLQSYIACTLDAAGKIGDAAAKGKDDISAELLAALTKSLTVLSEVMAPVSWKDNVLTVVYPDPVIFWGRNLGRFEYTFDVKHWLRAGVGQAFHCKSLEPFWAKYGAEGYGRHYGDIIHPHIYPDMHVCLGRAESTVTNLIREGALADIFSLINDLLYNDERDGTRPLIPITSWPLFPQPNGDPKNLPDRKTLMTGLWQVGCSKCGQLHPYWEVTKARVCIKCVEKEGEKFVPCAPDPEPPVAKVVSVEESVDKEEAADKPAKPRKRKAANVEEE